MKLAAFKAYCPFEIGDQVSIAEINKVGIITDIATIHSLKDGSVTFLYELDNDGKYLELQIKENAQE